MPEVRFDDLIKLYVNNRSKIEHNIDPIYCHVCEINSIEAISHTTPIPIMCGLKVQKNKLFIDFADQKPLPEYIIVKLSAIRKGRINYRFYPRTKEEKIKNDKFWYSWKE
jgi:hypothetical protein